MFIKLWLPMKRLVVGLFSFLVIYIIVGLVYYEEFLSLSNPSGEYRAEWYELNSSTMCNLPLKMQPFDPLIMKFIQKKSSLIHCVKTKNKPYDSLYNLYQGQSLSYMNDKDPIVRIFRIRGHEKSLKCLYQPFDREGTSDDDVKMMEKRPIIGHKLNLEKIGVEFVSIECYISGSLVYNNIHSWPSRVPSTIRKSSNDSEDSIINDNNNNNSQITDDYKPSVMFLVIESMSYLNFKRFMVKTNQALSKLSNNFIMRGLNKLADNSYPNIMPILSGYRPYYQEWPYKFEIDTGPYDEVQFIWKDFQKQNYTTGYVEDHPYLSLFNYMMKGFEKIPVDWYPRPYWLRMYDEAGIESKTFCYKNKPKILAFLKQLKQFLNKTAKTKQPFFLWSFYIQITHDDFNKAQLIDRYIADFIESSRSILEDTIFVLMGDHGNRFGPMMKTEYGQIESKMPLFNIHIPPKLLKRHPHLAHYLQLNEKSLTTWLDVREILKDVVSGNYEPIIPFSKRNAYSIWREEVPWDRSCRDALIPLEFCLCTKRQDFPTDSNLAQIVSTKLVDKLNQDLSKYKNCHELSLKKIYTVKTIYFPGLNETNNRVEIVISVNPSDGLLQAQLSSKNSTNFQDSKITDWTVEGDVSRLNAYGNQSSCIKDAVLRKYCYCRKI